jgi:hypothetical protein
MISIASNADWQAGALPGWLTASPVSGRRNGGITLTASLNTSTQARRCTLTVTAASTERSIILTQAGAAPQLEISPAVLAFRVAGETRTLAVAANIDWQIGSHPDWVVVTPSADRTGIQVTAAANHALAIRRDTLTLTGGGLRASVLLEQEAVVPYLRVSPDSLRLAAPGETKTLSLASNQSWRVEVPAGWLTVNATEGKGEATLSFTAAPNDTPGPRSCLVTVTAGALSHRVLFHQVAAETLPDGTGLVVAPNPAQGTLVLRLGEQTGEVVQAQLFNNLGQAVAHYQLSVVDGKVKQTLLVGALPRGLYVLQVHSATGKQQRKVLLQ